MRTSMDAVLGKGQSLADYDTVICYPLVESRHCKAF